MYLVSLIHINLEGATGRYKTYRNFFFFPFKRFQGRYRNHRKFLIFLLSISFRAQYLSEIRDQNIGNTLDCDYENILLFGCNTDEKYKYTDI